MKQNYETPQIEVINIELEECSCLTISAELPSSSNSFDYLDEI